MSFKIKARSYLKASTGHSYFDQIYFGSYLIAFFLRTCEALVQTNTSTINANQFFWFVMLYNKKNI